MLPLTSCHLIHLTDVLSTHFLSHKRSKCSLEKYPLVLSAAAKGKEWQVPPRLLGCLSNQSLLIEGNRTRSRDKGEQQITSYSIHTTISPGSLAEERTLCLRPGQLALPPATQTIGTSPVCCSTDLLFPFYPCSLFCFPLSINFDCLNHQVALAVPVIPCPLWLAAGNTYISHFLDLAFHGPAPFTAGWEEFHCSHVSIFLLLKHCTLDSWACSLLQLSLCSVLSSWSKPTLCLALQLLFPRPWVRAASVWDLLNLKNSSTPQEHLITFTLKAMKLDALAAHWGQPGLQTWPSNSIPITKNKTPITPSRTW